MYIQNEILLEYFRELIGLISVRELTENISLCHKIEETLQTFEASSYE